MSCSTCLRVRERQVQQTKPHQKLKRIPGTDTDSLFLQMLQLCAKSGMLQSIAAGDSILAPIGRAWCQLDETPTPKSDLAVLKLLVPGSLPHDTDAQQGDLVCLLYICLRTHCWITGALACHIVWLYWCMMMKRMMLAIPSATSCMPDQPAAMH